MRFLEEARQDLRFAARLARKHALLTGAMIATLALGIGLDAGAFTIIDGMLFRPRAERDPGSFVQVEAGYAQTPPRPAGMPAVSLRDFEALRRARSLARTAAWAPVPVTFTRPPSAPMALVSTLVTCDFFQVYGTARLIHGRLFRPDECEAAGNPAVVVVGEDLWRAALDADPAIVGQSIAINGRPFSVVGVIASGFDGQLRSPVWIPYTMQPAFSGGRDLFRERGEPWLMMIGRLNPAFSRTAAAAELSVVARQQDQLEPGRTTAIRVTNGSLIEQPGVRTQAFWIVPLVLGAVSLVMLVACVNVTMLLLSVAAARRHEIAVRITLGASRGRLMRMLVTESLFLAVAAWPASAYLAYQVPRLFRAQVPLLPYYPFRIDSRALAYMGAVTLLAGCAAGAAPALETLKRRLVPSRNRTTETLVAVQVAMSLVVMIGGGIFVRAEQTLRTADPGSDPAHLLLTVPRLGVPPYTAESAARFHRTLAERIRALPAVHSVASTSSLPYGDGESAAPVIALSSSRSGAAAAGVALDFVSASYFETMGLRLARGRTFRPREAAGGVAPIVIDERLQDLIAPGADPLGELVRDSSGRTMRVVGAVRHVPGAIEARTAPLRVYLPREDAAAGDAVLVRFEGDGAPVARLVRDAIQVLDPNAVMEPRTIASLRGELADRLLRITAMIVFLGAVATGLATIGIYSVAAFAAGRRTKEMGIRLALGATKRDVFRLILMTGARPIGLGLAAGVAAALLASRALDRALATAPIDARDPAAYGGMAVLLIVIALAAMLHPARRAAAVDPVVALRHD